MVNFTTSTTKSLDNKVVLNGVLTYTLSDDEMLRLKNILDGIVSERNGGNANTTTQSFSTLVSTPKYTTTKDFTCKFEIKKQTIKGSNKSLFCISRANGWTKSEKACMNDLIKALEGITEIDVEYTKDGVTRSFKAWGYSTKKKAEEMIDTLPKIIKADVLNNRFS